MFNNQGGENLKGQDHDCHIQECLNHARNIIAGRKWCDTCLRAYRLGRFEMAALIISATKNQVNQEEEK